jgi:hypothetical protein
VLFDVVAPVLIGWYMVDMREALSRNGFILSSWPKAWDAFYNRFRKTPVALVITLSNGRKVGGFWAEDPIASSFPADEDVFLPAGRGGPRQRHFRETKPDRARFVGKARRHRHDRGV